jgi:NAD-dependent DNA ligase
MPTERAMMILKSFSGLSNEAIERLSEAEAWKLIYGKPRVKRKVPLSVCFTGFREDEKPALFELAESHGLVVKDGVSMKLKFLVCGENAGPAKRLKAKAFGTTILSETEFSEMLSTGALPEDTTVPMPEVQGDDNRAPIQFPSSHR